MYYVFPVFWGITHVVIYVHVFLHGACQHVAHLVQEMDKYSQEEGRVAHSGKHAITTTKQSQGQRRKQQGLCNALGEDGNKLKPVAHMNSTQEQISVLGTPYCDSCRLLDHTNKLLSPRKEEGKSGLHPQNYPATTNPKRHSYHSVPTQNGEADIAQLNLIGTKNDFTSRRALIKTKSKSPRSLTQSERRAEAQLMDVLKRVQKLEDYQHAHNLEVTKVRPVLRVRQKKILMHANQLTNVFYNTIIVPTTKLWSSFHT